MPGMALTTSRGCGKEVWRLARVEPFASHFLEAVLLPWAYVAVEMDLPVF